MSMIPETPPDGLTRSDREQLAGLVRKRERLAKSDAKQHAARLIADGERQLATVFEAEDARWAEAVTIAEHAATDANAVINRHCEEAGVPESFRPRVRMLFNHRGENASRERRAELRKVLTTRVAALEKEAVSEIERRSLASQTDLIAGGLDSDAARQMLATLPDADALMPALDVSSFPEVQALTGDGTAGGGGV